MSHLHYGDNLHVLLVRIPNENMALGGVPVIWLCIQLSSRGQNRMADSSNQSPEPSPGVIFSSSIDSDGVDFLASVGDTAIDAIVSSGALDGVPILGLLSSGLRAAREIRDQLYRRKIVRFFQELRNTTAAQRKAFIRKLDDEGQLERFGETILLILEQVDDAAKPSIIGRILAAHISGTIASYAKAMRLVAIVNRAYAADLLYLKSFRPGVQHDHDVAASLFSVGLLGNVGIDGGNAQANSGGYIYDLNEYGRLLLAHGL